MRSGCKRLHPGKRVLMVLAIMICFPTFALKAVESETQLRVGMNSSELPGAMRDDEVVPNILLDLLGDVAKREGWKLQFVRGDAKTNLKRLEQGEIDLVLPYYPEADTLDIAASNRESVLSTWGLIYASPGSGIRSLLDLNGKIVAVAKGDGYFQDFEEMVRRFNINVDFVLVRNYEQVLHAIDRNHVDAGIVERTYGLLNQAHFQAESTPIVFAPSEVHYGASPYGDQKWLDTIDYYLALYKRDQDSFYYRTMEAYLGEGAHPLPFWVKAVIYLSAALLLISLIVLALQRREVLTRREELVRTNRELDDQVQQVKGQEAELLRFGSVISQMVEGVIITDIRGFVQYVNPAFESVTGEVYGEVVGKPFNGLLHGQDRSELLTEMNESLEGGNTWKKRFTYQRLDGGSVEVEGTVSHVRNRAGETVSYLAIIRDVSHEARLEDQLRQSQKLEAIGTLAGGIAHDFNNTLFAMMGYTDLILATMPEEDSRREMLQHVLQAGTRAKELIQQILTFSRKSDQTLNVLEIQPLVKETLKLLRPTMPANIRIDTHFEAEGSLVRSDATQIHQVVMNLCSNAKDAMEDTQGTLGISLREVMVDAFLAHKVSGLKQGQYVRLRVSDSGNGIPRRVLERIFEPFFTTKPSGKGTGMGLSVVHGILMNHGGAIGVESLPGEGTTFDLYFPRVTGQAKNQAVQAFHYPTGTERVIVVDDEEAVADTLQRMLVHLGYEVDLFTDSVEAWRRFQESDGDYDLLVTDLSMPGMSGIELASECVRFRPNLPVLLVTGYGQELSGKSLKQHGVGRLLSKPVLTGDLATAVRRLLDDKASQNNGSPLRTAGLAS